MDIAFILREYYGKEVLTSSPMEGYESINFKISTPGKNFVLKQHKNTTEEEAVLRAEHLVMQHVKELNNYTISFTQPTLDKQPIVQYKEKIYRLLSFVEGELLGNLTHTDTMLHSFGVFLGKLDLSLGKLQNDTLKAKETPWDLRHFYKNYPLLAHITDQNDRRLVDYFFLQYQEQIIPKQYQLRKQLIHNDANEWNVLITDNKVTGLIDFGDMCYSWLINELAIAITYVMMHNNKPLEAAAEVIKGYNETLALTIDEIDLLYYLVAARLCTSVCNSAYNKKQRPESTYITISEQPAWALLRNWISLNPIAIKNHFRSVVDFPKIIYTPLKHKLTQRDSYISKALSLSYKNPIHMHSAAMQYMYDTAGNTFLDAYNNIKQVGHSHPTVVKAGQKAMAMLNTNTRYVYDALADYAENLITHFPKPLRTAFFVNSGSAASDLAIRIAKTYTQKTQVMVLEQGYHGNTMLGMAVSHYKYAQQGGKDTQVDTIATPIPKFFNSGCNTPKETTAHFTKIARKQIEAETGNIAAFIAEPIVGCGGQVPLSEGYLKNVYETIRAQGGLCISDEVQVGFGRLGDHFWGFQMHNVVPDIVILGKPMGNGHPIGAVVTTAEIAERFDNGIEFFSSFGGNPVSCRIGQAVLKVIKEEKLQQHAKKVGEFLTAQLEALKGDYPEIADVRGSGLFLGVELMDIAGTPNTRLAQTIKNTLRDRFILIGTDGPYDSVLKIKPPLLFTLENAKKLVFEITRILMEESHLNKN